MFDFIFGNRKKSSQVYWRGADGKIDCPGDACPKKDCDDSCPIYLNTQASVLLQLGHGEKAVALFERILRIAPDFYDAWNNMASVYGSSGDYRKAYDCYAKAHEAAPEKIPPLFGLAISCRDLGQYEECLRWCDAYDKVCADHRLDDTRRMAQAKVRPAGASLGQSKPKASRSQITVAMELLAFAEAQGFMEHVEGFPHIPEIGCEAMPVAEKIFRGMQELQPEKHPGMLADITCAWCAYAGMGAVALWNLDWPSLKKIGVYEFLTAPRGLDSMDEFVTDLTGFQFGSKNSDELVRRIRLLSEQAIGIALADIEEQEKAGGKNELQSFLMVFAGMFLWGMEYQMQRLGMR